MNRWLLVVGAMFAFLPMQAQRQMEKLSRGIVAVRSNEKDVYVGWRLFGTDPSDIANKITRAFSDNVLMNNLRNGARATAMRYGWDEIASKYVALLQEIQISKRKAA